jgi:hypothetical protein
MAEVIAKNTDQFLKVPTIKLWGGNNINYKPSHGLISIEVNGISLTPELLKPIVQAWEKSLANFDLFMWDYLKALDKNKEKL